RVFLDGSTVSIEPNSGLGGTWRSHASHETSRPLPSSHGLVIDVVHSVPFWLPRTAQWTHRPLVSLPPTLLNQIACEKTVDPSEFPAAEIYSLDSAPSWRAAFDKLLRRLKIRRHLGLLVEIAKRHRAQVIHSHFGYTGWADLGAVKQTRAKH